jgi:hypothetical protein
MGGIPKFVGRRPLAFPPQDMYDLQTYDLILQQCDISIFGCLKVGEVSIVFLFPSLRQP